MTLAGILVPTSSQTGPQPCPGAQAISGYTSIFTLNSDMLFELADIVTGELDPEPEYEFTLCPNTVFDFNPPAGNNTNNTSPSIPLMPVLDNVIFKCGLTGSVDGGCIFNGGDTQVQIEDSTVGTYPITAVTFEGVTFAEFEDAAVSGGAASTTTVTIIDSNFEVSMCIAALIVIRLPWSRL